MRGHISRAAAPAELLARAGGRVLALRPRLAQSALSPPPARLAGRPFLCVAFLELPLARWTDACPPRSLPRLAQLAGSQRRRRLRPFAHAFVYSSEALHPCLRVLPGSGLGSHLISSLAPSRPYSSPRRRDALAAFGLLLPTAFASASFAASAADGPPSDSNIAFIKTPSGLEYFDTLVGGGTEAVAGTKIKAHYSGR